MTDEHVLPFDRLSSKDVSLVGGKNASLGELIGTLAPMGVQVPPGFATTADAYRLFLGRNELEAAIAGHLADYHESRAELPDAAAAIRKAIVGGEWPAETREAIVEVRGEIALDASPSSVAYHHLA